MDGVHALFLCSSAVSFVFAFLLCFVGFAMTVRPVNDGGSAFEGALSNKARMGQLGASCSHASRTDTVKKHAKRDAETCWGKLQLRPNWFPESDPAAAAFVLKAMSIVAML